MTIKEIAATAGVSIGTVDRVIHQRDGVRPETRARIEAILKENDFRLNAYARSLKLGSSCVIGILIPELQSEFAYWRLVSSGFDQAERELASFGVRLVRKEFSRDKAGDFTRCFRLLAEKEVDCILLPPFIPDELSVLATSSIPYAFIDSDAKGYKSICTIAQNPYKGGYTAGHMAALLSKGRKGVYLCMQIHPDAMNSFERARGFQASIEQDSAAKVVGVEVSSVVEIPAVLDRVFSGHDDIVGIFTVNSITSVVGSYLVMKHMKNQVVLVGYDLVEENREALLDGRVDCVISQRPFFQGYTAVNQIYRYIVLGEKQQGQEIPIDIYFKDNLIDNVE